MSRCEAMVVGMEGEDAWVEVPERAQACGACRQSDACHSGLLGLRQGPRRYRVRNGIGARPGERVALDVADAVLWRVSVISYLIPALLGIAGAALGLRLAGDGGALAGLGAGLISGFLLLRRSELRARRAGTLLSLHPLTPQVRLFKESP